MSHILGKNDSDDFQITSRKVSDFSDNLTESERNPKMFRFLIVSIVTTSVCSSPIAPATSEDIFYVKFATTKVSEYQSACIYIVHESFNYQKSILSKKYIPNTFVSGIIRHCMLNVYTYYTYHFARTITLHRET